MTNYKGLAPFASERRFVQRIVRIELLLVVAIMASACQAQHSDVERLTNEEIARLLGPSSGATPNLRWPELEKLIQHGDEPVVRQALHNALKEKDPEVRLRAQFALFRLRDAPEQRLLSLLESLRAETWQERYLARAIVGYSLQPRDDEYVLLLLDALSWPEPYVRGSVVMGLSVFASDSQVLAALLHASEDDSSHVRAETAGALHMAVWGHPHLLEHDDVVRTVTDLARDEAAEVRQLACASLKEFKENQLAVQTLLDALRDHDPLVRAQAVYSLAFVGLDASRLLSVLLHGLDDPAWQVQMRAIQALGQIGPTAAAALPRLRDFLASDRYELRTTAEEAIRLIVSD
jgi:HEAT repeat protein